ncbi:MAG: PD-(D/E)XK nuclease family protein [Clostridia bacterium]|nr:PD-(D/E)XK nuclease family protein [Clostridia bacterium]
MACNISFLIGRAGSGKSSVINDGIAQALKSGHRAFLLVPEPFTFETERMLANRLEMGFTQNAVYSFTSLSEFVLFETGDRTVYLSHQGKRMVIRKAIEENKHALLTYGRVADSAGFTERLEELFSRFKRFMITPELLNFAANHEKAPTGLFAKLHDLALIFEKTEEYLSSRYLDSEDMVNQPILRLKDSSIAGSMVFVDGFEFLTEQKYRVLGELMKLCSDMTIALCMDGSKNCRDSEIFSQTSLAYTRLFKTASELGCNISTQHITRSEGIFSPSLSLMERELFAWPHEESYSSPIEDGSIELFAASSIALECDMLCNEIIRRAKAGTRFCDMAVLTANSEAYNAALVRSLRRFSIPFFMDMTHPLTKHPLSDFILASLNCVTGNYKMRDVLCLIKTGLISEDKDALERFENYILKYGIEGAKRFEQFEREGCTPDILAIKDAVISPLKRLQSELSSKKSVSHKLEKLYDYICRQNIADKLKIISNKLREEGLFELCSENEQAFDITMKLLGQMHTILGSCNVSSKRFLELMLEALSSYSIGIIPTTADQLLIGDVNRTCFLGVKQLFVIGANEGFFPVPIQDSDMIDDRELAFLNDLGIKTWDSSKTRNAGTVFGIYSALCKPTDKLYISYLASSDAGLPPAAVAEALMEIFQALKPRSDIGGYIEPEHPEMCLSQLAQRLRNLCDSGIMDKETERLYGMAAGDARYKESLDMIKKALFFSPASKPIGKELAKELYGQHNIGSSSRLETFNICSFKYFMQYGLGVRPRSELSERATDTGTFYHDVLDKFIRHIVQNDVDLTALSPDDIESIVLPIAQAAAKQHNSGIFESTSRMSVLGRYMCECAVFAARAIVSQLALGRFKPFGSEITFGMDGAYPPFKLVLKDGSTFSITGSIDRVDYLNEGDTVYVRVIDYKTHGKAFGFGELYFGVKMQLALYIAALLSCDSALRACGIYYMPIISTPLSINGTDAEAIHDKSLSRFRLDGITLNDENIIQATEPIYEKNRSKSPVIGVKLNKDGEYTGNGLISSNVLDLTIEFASEKAKRTFSEMMEGNATPNPAISSRSTPLEQCRFCDFRSVCRFEPGYAGLLPRVIPKMTADDFEAML